MTKNIPVKIIVHCTDASYRVLPYQGDKVNEWHKERWGDISSLGKYGGYHILIERNGDIMRYRADDEMAIAAKGHNFDALHVCMAGDFDVEMPTAEQIVTLKEWLKKWCLAYKIDKKDIYPHRQFNSGKTCYGSLLSDDWARNLLEPIEKDKEKMEQKKRLETISDLENLINKIRLLIGILSRGV